VNSAGFLQLVGITDWPAFVLVSARVAGLFLMAPLWSHTGLPRNIRSGAAVVLSAALVPAVTPVAPMPDDMLASSLVLGAETLLGIAIGLSGAILIAGMTVAGEIASLQMGLSLGEAYGSLPAGTTVGIGQLKNYFALLVYMSLNGHLVLYEGLAASLRAVPPGQALAGLAGGLPVATVAGSIFSTGVRAAAPILVALLLTNLALAILGKAVPQLNVMMLSFPVTMSVGLLAFGASLPFLASLVAGEVDALPLRVGETIRAFTPAALPR